MDFDEQALQTVRETRLLIDRYDAWLFDEFEPYLGQRLIEIGCGLGNLMGRFVDRDFVLGIDICGDSVARVREKFAGHSNIEAYALDITDPQVLTLSKYGFDTAISLNVFEHIQDDELALMYINRLLQLEGKLVLILPAHKWLYGTMDRSIGHYRRYTKGMLSDILEKQGFRVHYQKYLNMVGALGWFVNGQLLRRRVPPSGQLRMLNLVMPFLQTVESRISPPFGVSLLSIAQKIAEL